MTNIQVRQATPDDAQTIADFNAAMALETEDKILEPKVIGNGVRRLFDTPELGFYLVAESVSGTKKSVIACLMITYEWSDWRDGLFWWIQSVYVAPDARRLGAFKALYQHVESLAQQDSTVCGIRLYVEQENTRAQNTYLSLGMQKTNYHLYEALF